MIMREVTNVKFVVNTDRYVRRCARNVLFSLTSSFSIIELHGGKLYSNF